MRAVRYRRHVHAQRRSHLAALRGGAEPGDARRRHPPRTVRDVRRRGLRQADPATGAGGTHRRARDHERRLGDHVGVVQRVAGGRARWTGAAGSLGRRIAAGARPRADPGVDHQVGSDGHRSGEGRRGGVEATPPRRVGRTAARCSSTSPSTCSGRRRERFPTSIRATSAAVRPMTPRCTAARGADRGGGAAGVHRRQRRVLGRRVGRAARRRRAPAGAVLLQRARARHVAGGPRVGVPPHARPAEAARRPRRRARHAARLPPRFRPLRRRGRGARRRLGRPTGGTRRRADRRR